MVSVRRRSSELMMTVPPLVWLIFFFLIPTLIVYAYAFRPSDPYGGIGEGWTLETWDSLWSGSYFKIIMRTLWFSAITTFLSLIFALPIGYFIARASERMRKIILLLIVLPFWSSFIVRIFAWKLLLHPEGLLKDILSMLHLVSPDTVFLYTAWSVVLVMVYTYLPFAILPIYAAASKFDYQLLEAARDLGMDSFRVFYKVFVPGVRKGIMTAVIMVFIPTMGAYVIPDVIGGPSTEMIGNKIVQRTFVDRNIPEASALSALLSMAVLIPLALGALIQSGSGRVRIFKGGH